MISDKKINFEEVQKKFYNNTWKNSDISYKCKPGVPGWKSYVPNRFFVKFLDNLKIKQDSKMLDVGCGAGRHTMYAAKKGFLAYGVDFSKDAIEKAKIYAKNQGAENRTRFLIANVNHLPFQDNLFDFINDSGCFNHILPEYWDIYAKGIYRVLKKRGVYRLKAASHKAKNVWGYKPGAKNRWILQTNNQYKYYFNKSELKDIFKDFKIIRLRDRFISRKNRFFFMIAKKVD